MTEGRMEEVEKTEKRAIELDVPQMSQTLAAKVEWVRKEQFEKE